MISMGVEYTLLSFARNEEGVVEASFINGKQKYGKILVESTEETSTQLGTLVFADDSETITVRMSVHRVGTQDLSEKEKNFHLKRLFLNTAQTAQITRRPEAIWQLPDAGLV